MRADPGLIYAEYNSIGSYYKFTTDLTDRKMSREPTDSLHSQPSLMEPDGAFRKSLKRPRIEADVTERETFDDFSLAAAEGGSGSVLPVRDGRFYMEDGSCVIRVEDTLFNVSFICKSHVTHVCN